MRARRHGTHSKISEKTELNKTEVNRAKFSFDDRMEQNTGMNKTKQDRVSDKTVLDRTKFGWGKMD